MPSVREQYWRYSLVALIVGLGTVVFVELTPFLGGLMGAATIYVLLRGQMCRLTGRHGWRRCHRHRCYSCDEVSTNCQLKVRKYGKDFTCRIF